VESYINLKRWSINKERHVPRMTLVVRTRLKVKVLTLLLISTAINSVRRASSLCIGSIKCSIVGFFLSKSYTDTRPIPSASGTNNQRPPSTKWKTAGVEHFIGLYRVGSCFSFRQPSSTDRRESSQRSSSSAVYASTGSSGAGLRLRNDVKRVVRLAQTSRVLVARFHDLHV
jgi:hypothetical protein